MESTDLTKQLAGWQHGGRDGLDAVVPAIYEELRKLACHHLAGVGETPTLQPTVLVHEAYLRLASGKSPGFASRRQFFAYASRVIRNVLVDRIRSQQSQKREGQRAQVQALDSAVSGDGLTPDLLLAIHEALNRLEATDPRQARIVEMKFFAGMRQYEIAETLEISLPTVERHWSVGKRRLALYLRGDGAAKARDKPSDGPANRPSEPRERA